MAWTFLKTFLLASHGGHFKAAQVLDKQRNMIKVCRAAFDVRQFNVGVLPRRASDAGPNG